MLKEILQILLPKAIDMGNLQVAAREFPLTLYANISNYYPSVTVARVRTIPAFSVVQVHVYRNDVELGRYAVHEGNLDINIEVNSDSPLVFKFFNLSVDTEVTITVEMLGGLYNAV